MMAAWLMVAGMALGAGPDGGEPAEPVRLYVIGDSTAAAYPPERRPLTGWAEVLQEAFYRSRLVVEDKARSGRSSKSFLEEGSWEPIRAALRKGDYVFVQFGHNDAKKDDPGRYTEPETTYRAFLARYVEETRAAGAVPVLLTPINRNRWDGEGRLVDTLGGYPEAVREVAREKEVALIDLHMLTREKMEALGPEKAREWFLYLEKGESPNYPEGIEDGTHLREEGAREVAKLVVEDIRRRSLPLAAWLKD